MENTRTIRVKLTQETLARLDKHRDGFREFLRQTGNTPPCDIESTDDFVNMLLMYAMNHKCDDTVTALVLEFAGLHHDAPDSAPEIPKGRN